MNIEFCNIRVPTNVSVLKWIQRNLVTKTKVMISYRWPTIKEQKLMRSKMGVCTFSHWEMLFLKYGMNVMMSTHVKWNQHSINTRW